MLNFIRFLVVAVWSAICVLSSLQAQAQTKPPLRIIVPFSAGGGTDLVGRYIANELSARINQPVLIINQVGANGYLGVQAVHNAPPDGNTLLLTTTNQAIYPAVRREMPFHVIDGFEPVMLVCTGPLILVARPQFPHKTMPELIEAARKNPGSIKYGSAGGVGNNTHLAMELLSIQAKIKMLHIPYRGSAPAIVDVLAGQIDFALSSVSGALQYFESKHLFALSQTHKTRASVAKEIPTIAEQTGLDYDVTHWYGFLAPPKTPADRVAHLNKELAAIVSMPKTQEFIRIQGFDPRPGTPEEFTRFLRSEMKLWVDVAKAANVAPE